MKTTKFIIAVSLALIFAAGFNNVFAQLSMRTGHPVINNTALVTYVVKIDPANQLKYMSGNYQVVMTDENNILVAPAQTYNKGVLVYTFHEGGTIRGIRVARMVKLPIAYGAAIDFLPCIQKGVFYGGASYLFLVRAVAADRKGPIFID